MFSESLHLLLFYYERAPEIAKTTVRAQGSSCKQKGRQRQRSELEGHDAVIKTSNEGGCYEYAMKTSDEECIVDSTNKKFYPTIDDGSCTP